jgi:diaminopimelate epimerase
MEIKFLKLESCSNDYIILEGFKNPLLDEKFYPKLAKCILRRIKGVGAQGLIFALKDKEAPLFARLFMESGEEEDADPDALRCLGRYAFDAGFLADEQNQVKTRSGLFTINAIDSQNISVQSGPPLYSDKAEEIQEEPNIDLHSSLILNEQRQPYSILNLNGLQAVFMVENFHFPFARHCKTLADHPDLHNATTLTFMQVYSRDVARVRTWHRKAGECNSYSLGAAAAVVASVLNGFLDREVLIHTKGGDLFINWEIGNNQLYMTAPVNYICTGTYDMDV